MFLWVRGIIYGTAGTAAEVRSRLVCVWRALPRGNSCHPPPTYISSPGVVPSEHNTTGGAALVPGDGSGKALPSILWAIIRNQSSDFGESRTPPMLCLRVGRVLGEHAFGPFAL